MRSINLLRLFGIRRNCLRSGRSRSLYLSIRRAIKQTVVIIGAYHFCQLRKNSIQHPSLKVNSICRGNYRGSSMWVPAQQVDYWSFILYLSNAWEKMGIQWSSASALYRHQESLWFSYEGGLVYILTEFGIPMTLIRLIKMCLTETYSRVRVGKNLSDMFPIRNGLK